MRNGIVENWEDMEKIWEKMYETLNIQAKDHPVLITEASLNPYSNR